MSMHLGLGVANELQRFSPELFLETANVQPAWRHTPCVAIRNNRGNIWMEKVAEYERKSFECKELALRAPTAQIRTHYLELSDLWKRLAEERRIHIQSRTMD